MPATAISLIIKGGPGEAVLAARNRGVSIHSLKSLGAESHADCHITYLPKVMSWFGEPGEAPYPTGALLHYYYK